ncbi:MAG: hypothetical protein WAK29_01000, partial [Terriglobales bacterium]
QIHGKLTVDTIRATPGIPSPQAYWVRFGSLANAYEAAGCKALHGSFKGAPVRKKTLALKERMTLDLIALFRASGRTVRSIHRGVQVQGVGTIGIEAAQWVRAARGLLRWEVRTGDNKRYKRMIVGRISPDRESIIDFVYLDIVPKTKNNFRITDKMLKEEPRGSAEEMVAVVIAHCSIVGPRRSHPPEPLT